MIDLDLRITGDALGSLLRSDPEELAYALGAIAEGSTEQSIVELAEYIQDVGSSEIVPYLTALLAVIDV